MADCAPPVSTANWSDSRCLVIFRAPLSMIYAKTNARTRSNNQLNKLSEGGDMRLLSIITTNPWRVLFRQPPYRAKCFQVTKAGGSEITDATSLIRRAYRGKPPRGSMPDHFYFHPRAAHAWITKRHFADNPYGSRRGSSSSSREHHNVTR